MIDPNVLFLLLLNLAFIGLLPFVFFKRDGGFNAMWWATAAPYLLCAASLVTSYLGKWPALVDPGSVAGRVLTPIAIVLAVGSIGLISFTLGTHRTRIALWHQSNDAPEHIVTHGAYRLIRHPFYSSFLLALLGGLLFCPQAGTLVSFLYGFVIMNHTAAREEKRLAASKFGAEYTAYMQRTGRFLPRLRGSSP